MKINVNRPPASLQKKPIDRLAMSGVNTSPQKEKPAVRLNTGRGQGFIYLGPPGSGKTTYCAEHPNPHFIIEEKETGVYDLMDAGLIPEVQVSPMKSWTDLIKFNDDALVGTSKFPEDTTLVYESLSGFEQVCHAHCCMLRYNNNWDSTRKGFMFYQEGYRVAAKEFWSLFVLQCCRLREKGFHIALTGHTQKITEKNIDDLDFMAAAGACQAATMDVMAPYFQNIFFIDRDIDVRKEGGNEHAKGKVVSANKKMFVTWSPWRKAAKNRYGLTSDIDVEGKTSKEMFDLFCKLAHLNTNTLRFIGLPRKHGESG